MSWQLALMLGSGIAATMFLAETVWSNRDDIITALIGPENFDDAGQ